MSGADDCDGQLKPLEGAESGGVGGFFKGVGKGFVGYVSDLEEP